MGCDSPASLYSEGHAREILSIEGHAREIPSLMGGHAKGFSLPPSLRGTLPASLPLHSLPASLSNEGNAGIGSILRPPDSPAPGCASRGCAGT